MTRYQTITVRQANQYPVWPLFVALIVIPLALAGMVVYVLLHLLLVWIRYLEATHSAGAPRSAGRHSAGPGLL